MIRLQKIETSVFLVDSFYCHLGSNTFEKQTATLQRPHDKALGVASGQQPTRTLILPRPHELGSGFFSVGQ